MCVVQVSMVLQKLAAMAGAGKLPYEQGFKKGYSAGLKYGNGPAGYAAGMQLADAKAREMRYMAMAALYAKAHNYRDDS